MNNPSMGLSAISPAVQKEAQSMAGMDPMAMQSKLLSNGVSPDLIALVMQATAVNNAKKTQQALASLQNPAAGTVQQQTQQAFQQMASALPQQQAQISQQARQAIQQHATEKARQGGIADLPMSPDLYSFGNAPHMAKGGIVAFNEGGSKDDADPSSISNMANMAGQAISDYFSPSPGGNISPGVDNYDPNSPAEQHYARAQSQANYNLTHPFGSEFFPALHRAWDQSFGTAQPAAAPPAAAAQPSTSSTTPQQEKHIENLGAKVAGSETAKTAFGTKGPVSSIPIYNLMDDPSYKDIYERSNKFIDDIMADPAYKGPGDKSAFLKKQLDPTNPANSATNEYLNWLGTQKQELAQRKDQNPWQSLMMGGFAMAHAATINPHGGFLGAMAAGGEAGGKQYLETLADIRKSDNDLANSQYKAQQHLADGATAQYENELARSDMLKGRVQSSYEKLAGVQMSTIERMDQARNAAQMHRDTLALTRGQNLPSEVYHSLLTQTNPATNKPYTTSEAYAIANPSVNAANIRSNQQLTTAQMASLIKDEGYKNGEMLSNSSDPTISARGQKMMDEARSRVLGIAGGGNNILDSAIAEELAKRKAKAQG